MTLAEDSLALMNCVNHGAFKGAEVLRFTTQIWSRLNSAFRLNQVFTDNNL